MDYDKLKKYIQRKTWRISRREDREDLQQELFLQALRCERKNKNPETLDNYTKKSIDGIAKNKKLEIETEELSEDIAGKKTICYVMQDLGNILSEVELMIVKMKIEGHTLKNMAKKTNLSVDQVRYRINKIKQKLKGNGYD